MGVQIRVKYVNFPLQHKEISKEIYKNWKKIRHENKSDFN